MRHTKHELPAGLTTDDQIAAELARRSRDGGAWVCYRARAFEGPELRRYKNPSSVPDGLYDRCLPTFRHGYPMVGWKGQLRTFTQAAIGREQNRGITCE